MNKLAAVLVCRNDGWKDDNRILTCLLSMLEECDEVWFIDWNSPNIPLIDKIRTQLPTTGKLKHVLVTPTLVNELLYLYPGAEICNMCISRNIAIKRTTCDWIVSTNIDIIAPKKDSLFQYVKDNETFYTISRREASLQSCNKYTPQQWKDLREELEKDSFPRVYLEGVSPNDHFSILNCCGDFQIAHRNVWHNIRGYEEAMVYGLYSDSNIQKKAVNHGFKLKPLFNPPVFHIEHQPYRITADGTKETTTTAITTNSQGRYNNPYVWMEFFEKTTNHRQWGCNDIDFNVEVI